MIGNVIIKVQNVVIDCDGYSGVYNLHYHTDSCISITDVAHEFIIVRHGCNLYTAFKTLDGRETMLLLYIFGQSDYIDGRVYKFACGARQPVTEEIYHECRL